MAERGYAELPTSPLADPAPVTAARGQRWSAVPVFAEAVRSAATRAATVGGFNHQATYIDIY